jgi:hypothetical protein
LKLEVIPIKDFIDHKLFDLYLEITSQKDIFFDYEYLVVNDNHENGNTFIALFHNQNQILASYAFVKRSFIHKNESLFDLITPYEYGGVLIHSGGNSAFIKFKTAFEGYCNENDIITDFQRVDPFINDQVERYAEEIDLNLINENIYVDLKESEEKIFSNFHKNNRRDVRYAIRNGVTIESHAPSKKSINIFYNIYKETMEGKDANQFYYFNESYFKALETISPDKLSVFIAYNKDNVPISSALILKKADYCHYHLSGTNRDYAKLCGNNLLLYKVISIMKKKGKEYFHLGGAAKSQEGLYRFKKKFSKKTIPYYIVKRVFNNYLYNQINQDLIKDGRLVQEDLNSNFFPLYRKN